VDEIRSKIEETIGLIRPALQADGGDVELVDVVDRRRAAEAHRRVSRLSVRGANAFNTASSGTSRKGFPK